MMQDILVVKIGGGANVDTAEILRDLAGIAREQAVVVVHGVSERMARLSAERGMAVQMLQSPDGHSSRYTPVPVRDLFVEAASQVNDEIVRGLIRLGIAAQGLTQSVVIQGERKTAIRAVMARPGTDRARRLYRTHHGRGWQRTNGRACGAGKWLSYPLLLPAATACST
ncbi:MAG: hypothetical protein H6671_00330 [Anaerolineaceae bacterium]|nr:hypothetical protein [Anaerolineaceae bacterium]